MYKHIYFCFFFITCFVCRYSKILVYTCVSTILALELLFQALRQFLVHELLFYDLCQYIKILVSTCVITIFSSRTVIS